MDYHSGLRKREGHENADSIERDQGVHFSLENNDQKNSGGAQSKDAI